MLLNLVDRERKIGLSSNISLSFVNKQKNMTKFPENAFVRTSHYYNYSLEYRVFMNGQKIGFNKYLDKNHEMFTYQLNWLDGVSIIKIHAQIFVGCGVLVFTILIVEYTVAGFSIIEANVRSNYSRI